MKRFIYSSMLLMGICVLVACTGKSSSHPFGGTFFTEEGVRFELKADSTTLIQFNYSLTYEGTWQVCKSADNLEYATIEFAGYPAYYFLKDEFDKVSPLINERIIEEVNRNLINPYFARED